VGVPERGAALVSELVAHLRETAENARKVRKRPRVFFEEWPDPLISGIRWVSELLEIAGGDDVCIESRAHHDAKGRTFSPADVAARDPEIIIASWCGKPVDGEAIAARWPQVRAVIDKNVYEVASSMILQPGPAALTDGVDALAAVIMSTLR
jgi:iron complex transport system substrate-binding protein